MRILLVEDDVVQGEALAALLCARGHVARHVPTAEGAKKLLEVHAFDALVLDHLLPGADGLGLLRWARTQEALLRTPAVLTTALADAGAEQLRRDLAPLRPAALLRKPFDVPDVIATLDSLTERPV